jgi:hypothetical protein
METIKVIWPSYNPEAINRGYWDQGILEDMFTRAAPYNWQHQEDFEGLVEHEGAVVVLNGRMHPDYIEAIQSDLNKLRWVVLIITGDEEAVFPFEEVRHPLLRVWMQLPRMNRHNDVSFKLPNGYRAGSRQILSKIGSSNRVLDFSFIGQVNHPRRQECCDTAESLSSRYPNRLIGTDGFGKEAIDQWGYLGILTETRIALCPSGVETPDTFRLYEALEAGCLPIVDAFASKNQDWGFWGYLFKDGVPFPVIPYWDELPNLLPELLKEWPHNANKVSAWWQLQKRNMHNKLIDDIKDISR